MAPPRSAAALPPLLGSQEPLLAAAAASPIFQRDARIIPPDRTLQEEPLLRYPTLLDPPRASSPVGVLIRRRSLLDPDPARPVLLRPPAATQADTELCLPHRVAPRRGLDQASPRLHLRTTVDLRYRRLQEGGLRSLTTGRRRLRPPVIGRRCPATCRLLPRLSTPNLPPPCLPPHPLAPQQVEVRLLSRQGDRVPLRSLRVRL